MLASWHDVLLPAKGGSWGEVEECSALSKSMRHAVSSRVRYMCLDSCVTSNVKSKNEQCKTSNIEYESWLGVDAAQRGRFFECAHKITLQSSPVCAGRSDTDTTHQRAACGVRRAHTTQKEPVVELS